MVHPWDYVHGLPFVVFCCVSVQVNLIPALHGHFTYEYSTSAELSWWRHQMETFSALLAICAGNSPVPGEFPTQRPVTRSVDAYFELCPDKRLSKQPWGWWFETRPHSLWRHRNVRPCCVLLWFCTGQTPCSLHLHKGNNWVVQWQWCIPVPFNTLRPRQNSRHFPDDIFKRIFLNKNVWISINISLKFVPRGPINNIPTLVQVMAWRRPGDKPLSEPMVVRLLASLGLNELSYPGYFRELHWLSMGFQEILTGMFPWRTWLDKSYQSDTNLDKLQQHDNKTKQTMYISNDIYFSYVVPTALWRIYWTVRHAPRQWPLEARTFQMSR